MNSVVFCKQIRYVKSSSPMLAAQGRTIPITRLLMLTNQYSPTHQYGPGMRQCAKLNVAVVSRFDSG